jgi:segregation and condensation protein B
MIDSRDDAAGPSPDPSTPGKATVARFTLERLSSAFARLMGAPSSGVRVAEAKPQIAVEPDDIIENDDSLPVTPRMIVEGMLFVGGKEGRPLTNREIAGQIRDVEPAEVDELVVQLNAGYQQDDAAYEIVGDSQGYRLQLRGDLSGIRDRVRGRIRAAKLTPAAMEVLSVVAYRQGVTSDELNRLRGSQSHAILAQLVRRQLVRVERPTAPPRAARYHTTERFNQLFRIASPADLPGSEDLADG